MPWAAAAIAAQLLTNHMGQQTAQDQMDAANQARQQALDQFTRIGVPSVDAQTLNSEEYQNTGQLNPLLEQLLQQGPSALENVSIDPRLRNEQMQALEQLSGLAQGNVTPADIAGFQLARRNAAAEAQAKQGQILQEMQARGQGGSGAELIARLQSGQSGADRLQQAQLQQAQAMQQARLQALSNQANLASSLRSQDYGQARDTANAKDIINAFNTQNAQRVAGSNTDTQNRALAANLQNQQAISKANTDIRNQQQRYNKELNQTNFNNQIQLAGGTANQYGAQAGDARQNAANTAGMYGQMGQAIGTGLTAFANSRNKNEDNSDDEGT